MDTLLETVRDAWSFYFTLPKRGETRYGWTVFTLLWLLSTQGIIPGVLAAAYVIGQFHINNQLLQDAVSVTLAFAGTIIENLAFWFVGFLFMTARHAIDDVHVYFWVSFRFAFWEYVRNKIKIIWLELLRVAVVYPLGLIFILGPFIVSFWSIYWYFTYFPTSPSNVAVSGAAGALLLKVLLTLLNVVVLPAIKTFFVGMALKPFWSWLHRKDDKPKASD